MLHMLTCCHISFLSELPGGCCRSGNCLPKQWLGFRLGNTTTRVTGGEWARCRLFWAEQALLMGCLLAFCPSILRFLGFERRNSIISIHLPTLPPLCSSPLPTSPIPTSPLFFSPPLFSSPMSSSPLFSSPLLSPPLSTPLSTSPILSLPSSPLLSPPLLSSAPLLLSHPRSLSSSPNPDPVEVHDRGRGPPHEEPPL